jgi:MGT family glycosyltransferase
VLSPFPPSFRDPSAALPATTHSFRPLTRDPAEEDAPPAWLAGLEGAPIVYFTLGTVFNLESGDLFQRVIAGLRELPVHLVVTVGRDLDPAELGPQPANVRIERYVPQASLLPRCALVVSHGGSGSVMGALAHGLPMVLVPLGADQPLNAARCTALGVARELDAAELTPEAVRAAAATMLADPAARRAAARLREEIAALPGPEHAVRLLEGLAARRRSA